MLTITELSNRRREARAPMQAMGVEYSPTPPPSIGARRIGGTLTAPAIALNTRATTLRFVPQANLTVLDPTWTTEIVANSHNNYVFDTLYGSDSKLRPLPQMAEGHEVSADGRVWRIRLREGLWFHDGTKVLAHDCDASLARWAKRDSFGQLLDRVVESWGGTADRTVEIKLTRPFPLMLEAIGKPETPAFVMPEHLARTDPNTTVTEMVGSGSYRFIAGEFNSGSRAVYEWFERYVSRGEAPDSTSGGKVAHFQRVEWVVIPDHATASAALATGEVDWWERPLTDLIPSLKQNPGVTVRIADPGGRVVMMRMNCLHKPFDNAKVRRAGRRHVAADDLPRSVSKGHGGCNETKGPLC